MSMTQPSSTNLGRQLYRRVLLLSLIALLATLGTFIASASTLYDHLNKQLRDTAQLMTNAADQFLYDQIRQLRLTAHLLSSNTDSDRLLQLALAQDASVRTLRLVAPDGQVTSYRGATGQPQPERIDAQPWLKALARQSLYLELLHAPYDEIPRLLLALPVVDRQGYQQLSLTAEIDLFELWKRATRSRHSATGQIYLIDEQGQVLLHRNLNLQRQRPLLTHVLGHPPGTLQPGLNLLHTPDGWQLIWLAPLQQAPWQLVIQQPLLASIGPALLIPLVLLVALLLIALLTRHLMRFVQQQLQYPLETLTDSVMRFQRGDLAHRVPLPPTGELGNLGSVLNRMAERLLQTLDAQQQQMQALHQARQETEQLNRELADQIEERTRQLMETQLHKERIQYLAHHDPLTGLANRSLFNERLQQALEHATPNHKLALFFCDLDHFKTINDTLGHPAGDQLLCSMAQRLRSCAGPDGLVARLGGDEFAILKTGLHSEHAAFELGQQLVRQLSEPYRLQEQRLHASASVGLTLAPDQGTELERLLRNADIAMYAAKQQGRNQYQAFTAELEAQWLATLPQRRADLVAD